MPRACAERISELHSGFLASRVPSLMCGFCYHFNNLGFNNTQHINSFSAAHVFISLVSNEIMKCWLLKQDSLRGSSFKLGTMQRILAWPLRQDDTHKSRSVNKEPAASERSPRGAPTPPALGLPWPRQAGPWCTRTRHVRPISLLILFLLRFDDLNFPGNSLWT